MTGFVVHSEGGVLAPDTAAPDLRSAVEAACDQGHLVLHFHGGLVSEASGRAGAARLAPLYEAAGAAPVFSVWEASLSETLWNNLGGLRAERFFRAIYGRVRGITRQKLAQAEDGGARGGLPPVDPADHERALDDGLLAAGSSSGADLPRDALTELSEDEQLLLVQSLQYDAELGRVCDAVARARGGESAPSRSPGEDEAAEDTLMDDATIERLMDAPPPGTRGLLSTLKVAKVIVFIAARVIHRMITRRDHGLHATVVEEILRELYLARAGKVVWDTIKGDTRDAFRLPASEGYAGSLILEAIGAKLAAGSRPRVTLVGHSTGAIYIAYLLAAAADRLPPFAFDVVLLAPAATFDLAASTFIAHRDRVGAFRMFTMTDRYERADTLVPVLYPHSLLYFVSGVAEAEADTPLIGMERFFDRERYPAAFHPAVEAFRTFIEEGDGRAVWSVDAGAGGRSSEAVRHGDFDDDRATLESLQHFLNAAPDER